MGSAGARSFARRFTRCMTRPRSIDLVDDFLSFRSGAGPLKKVQLITDGACLGNPGPGGWAAILRCDGQKKELFGCEKHTTNNRMELTAAIEGLRALKVGLRSGGGDRFPST